LVHLRAINQSLKKYIDIQFVFYRNVNITHRGNYVAKPRMLAEALRLLMYSGGPRFGSPSLQKKSLIFLSLGSKFRDNKLN